MLYTGIICFQVFTICLHLRLDAQEQMCYNAMRIEEVILTRKYLIALLKSLPQNAGAGMIILLTLNYVVFILYPK